MRRMGSIVGVAIVAGALVAGGTFLVFRATGVDAQGVEAAYVAPRSRTGDGSPDLNGIWHTINTANWDLLSRSQDVGPEPKMGAWLFVPPGHGVVDGDEIPYQSWAAARRNQNFENRANLDPIDPATGDPEAKCFLPGVPRATYMPYPFQILQGEREILIHYQFARASRVIHMNERVDSLVDSWMGVSNGHWEGDTLVVEVSGFNGLAWLDRAGNFFSNNARVVERYTPVSPYHLQYEATIEDPDVFTRPWTIRMPLYRVVEEGAELIELNCVELAEEAMFGEIRFLTEEDFEEFNE